MNNIKNNETAEQIEETEETGELEVNRVKSLKTNVKGGTWGGFTRCCIDGGGDGSTSDGFSELLSSRTPHGVDRNGPVPFLFVFGGARPSSRPLAWLRKYPARARVVPVEASRTTKGAPRQSAAASPRNS